MSEQKYACTEGDDCCCEHITLTANADVAQPEEQPICSGKVAGSTPAVGSTKLQRWRLKPQQDDGDAE